MQPRHRGGTIVAAVMLATGVVPTAAATTVHVDHAGGGDHVTIQEGIDAATYGDTVLVAPGTYYERLYMGPDADGVTLLSAAGPGSTTIDNEGVSLNSVIHCENVGTDTRIEGFTITGGNSYYWGGGIRADHADIRVASCTITDCLALQMQGGAIGSDDSSIMVSGCLIEGNRGGDGGGIGVWGGEAIITGNTIIGNEAASFTADQTGGGIYVSCDRAEINDNVIGNNSALFGGGICSWWTDELLVRENTIESNFAGYAGGGLALWSTAGTVSENTIMDNEVNMRGGGALDIRDRTGTLTLSNNVLFGNTGGDGESAIRIRQAGPVPALTGNYLCNEAQFEVLVDDTPLPDTLDFTGNWWGTDDPVEIAARVYDCSDDPGLLWCIDFSNWCTDPSCSGQLTSVEEPEGTTQASWGRIKSLYR